MQFVVRGPQLKPCYSGGQSHSSLRGLLLKPRLALPQRRAEPFVWPCVALPEWLAEPCLKSPQVEPLADSAIRLSTTVQAEQYI